jgi:hypothetical protein
MACFDNIISIRELCSAITPQTFYLNDIGINANEIEGIGTADYTGVEDFITQKSEFAIRQVQGDIYGHLSPHYRASSILASNRVGAEANTKTLIAQTGYVGIEVKMHNPASFVDFTLSDLSIYTNFTGTVPVLVYDLLQGKLLGTINIESVAGQISTGYESLTIAAPRKQLHLWLGYNSTPDSISSYKTTTNSGCSTCTGFTFNNRFIRATGAQVASPFTAVTVDSLTHTGGLSFNYSVTCNHYDWLCVHRQILGLPFLYRTGMEIMQHARIAAINQRSMTITTVKKDVLEEKYNFYAQEYTANLQNVLRNMRLPSDVNCFHCNTLVKSITTLP